MSLVTRTFNNAPFVFREDGWFNMTKAAKHFGKDLSNFWKSDDTSEYIKALLPTLPNPVKSTEFAHLKGKLIDSTMGRNGGTWAHPKLAVFFARWLDVKFAVWCDAMIEDILKGKVEVVVTKSAESAVMALPGNYAEALRSLADAWEREETARKALAQTEQAKTRLQQELVHVSIAEWQALRHTYLPHPMKGKLSAKARAICEARGIQVQKQHNTHHKYGQVTVNVYRTDILDDAAALLGIVVAYRPQVA